MDKETFLSQFNTIPAQFPIQGEARAAIHNGLDFPTTRDEQWKYTRVKPVVERAYRIEEGTLDSIESLKIDASWAYIVFVNGEYSPQLSDEHPTGVTINSMKQAEGTVKDRMLLSLGSLTNHKDQAFPSLNTSYFKDGAFIEVNKNAIVEQPIAILNIVLGESQAVNARNLIHVHPGAQATIVHHFEGIHSAQSFTNSVCEILVDENAHANYYLIQNEGLETSAITNTNVSQKRDSRFTVVTVTKSGQLVRNNINMAITQPGCESNMMGIYFTDGSQHVDNQTYADHQEHGCNSNELYKGVMADRSTGVFNGKIMVHKAAQQTNAFQSNQNILLSDRATINTKPELEIYADDVKCSHGCTIGQLDEEALFYLQSRGLGKEAANRLLVQAFAQDVIDSISIPSLKENVESFIESKFE
ncbi:MAG: Fe-S cluster assembly protein SufD [Salibacteraceae bacterium]